MPGSDYSEHWNEARDGRDAEELNDVLEDFLEEAREQSADENKNLPDKITKNIETHESN